MIKALIFDFDGVLVMSEEPRFKVLQSIAKRHDAIITEDHFKDLVGRTTKNFLAHHFADLPTASVTAICNDFKREFKDRIIDHVTPIVATTNFIRSYNGPLDLAVASGSDVKVLETMLRHLGIRDQFAHVLGKEHVTSHKPDPAVYKLALSKLGIEAEECLIIEDSISGVTAALGAGIKTYVFLNGLNNVSMFDDLAVAGFISQQSEITALTQSNLTV